MSRRKPRCPFFFPSRCKSELIRKELKKTGQKKARAFSCRKDFFGFRKISHSSQIHQQLHGILSFSLLCFIACPWKYMREGEYCHSATHVSWDMQGLLFVLETQQLYQGYSWAPCSLHIFLSGPNVPFSTSYEYPGVSQSTCKQNQQVLGIEMKFTFLSSS